MSLDALMNSLPVSARDLKTNYSQLVQNNHELTPQQLWGTVVASAIATRSEVLTAAVLDEAPEKLSLPAMDAAQAAAAVMGMTNIWYRFHHLASNPSYASMPARLRMSAVHNLGAEEVDFELWAMAVSAINGCGKCVDAHERTARQKGVSEEVVAATVRVAAVVHALGVMVDQLSAHAASA
ncbi:carboxymuconolactone decarboxylase family protein [Telmatobacter bradus]|uniref:carboxymuconolactone decarboxylase family protein n=1 Tax=Telmatobacter bradus TaxID=474953 RepID=UPI003B432BEA